MTGAAAAVDEVTVVQVWYDPTGNVHYLFCGHAERMAFLLGVLKVPSPHLGPDTAAYYSVNEEGVWWIRGHHGKDSSEGQALLAAHALCHPM